jgi:NAD(P)-dependent dehydrogenase (short-subunit alcohol dehydrogenase family)
MELYSLITGSAGLLGKYHAEALLQLNLNIILTDIDRKGLDVTFKHLKNLYPKKKIITFLLDVSSTKSIEKTVKKLKMKNIIINNLINNATIDAKIKKKTTNKNNNFENFSLEVWNKEIKVGLTGAMLCSKIIGSEMVKNKIKGNIVNIASDLSVIAPNQNIYKSKNGNFVKPVTYSVIKHGIVGLTKYLSTYWAEKNIKVNSLSPGSVLHEQPKELQNKLKKLIPMNRLAKKKEYMGAIKFLCSSDSDYMTGQNLVIDGGRSVW